MEFEECAKMVVFFCSAGHILLTPLHILVFH